MNGAKITVHNSLPALIDYTCRGCPNCSRQCQDSAVFTSNQQHTKLRPFHEMIPPEDIVKWVEFGVFQLVGSENCTVSALSGTVWASPGPQEQIVTCK